MSNNIFTKLNLYDQLGYIFVGSIAWLVIASDLYLLNRLDVVLKFTAQSAILWLFIVYFTGHLLQAVANIIIRENKTDFTDTEKIVLIKKYF